MLYVLKGEGVNERQFSALEALRNLAPENDRVPLARVRDILRRQAALLRADEPRALAAIPGMLLDDPSRREKALGVIMVAGRLNEDAAQRLERLRALIAPGLAVPARSPRLRSRKSGRAS